MYLNVMHTCDVTHVIWLKIKKKLRKRKKTQWIRIDCYKSQIKEHKIEHNNKIEPNILEYFFFQISSILWIFECIPVLRDLELFTPIFSNNRNGEKKCSKTLFAVFYAWLAMSQALFH